ncbi:Aqualysin-1 [Dactylellina cionopaga]|nr:Aqualysin-1 [Dactylellina cionopaga]
MKFFALLSTTFLLAAAAPALGAPVSTNGTETTNEIAPVNGTLPTNGTVPANGKAPTNGTVPINGAEETNQYIVVLADDEKRPMNEVWKDMGYENGNFTTFGSNIRGFTMITSPEEAARMKSMPNVASIDMDSKVRIVETGTKGPVKRYTGPSTASIRRPSNLGKRGNSVQQADAPWNLERISSKDKIDLEGRDSMDMVYKYRYDDEFSIATGVDVYVVDTGIDVHHVDFGRRAKMVFSAFGEDMTDGVGHGTHVAGTVGSKTYGVAKNVNLLGVKVFDRRGDASAGNDGKDSCKNFPGAYNQKIPSILTVGASDPYDNRADFSATGQCVDIHAPGVDVISTYIPGLLPNSTWVSDGTSMAVPAVAGVIAGEAVKNKNLRLDPAGMKKLILGTGLRGVLKGVEGGGNVLLNTGFVDNPKR